MVLYLREGDGEIGRKLSRNSALIFAVAKLSILLPLTYIIFYMFLKIVFTIFHPTSCIFIFITPGYQIPECIPEY